MSLSPDDLKPFAEAATKAAHLAGEVLLKWLGKTKPMEKGPGDLVTQADFESQQVIKDFLLDRFPQHQFVGEESLGATTETGSSGSPKSSTPASEPLCWVVDPLDGTTNFVHQLHSFSVSIGLVQGETLLVGVVFDPVIQETYVGIRGGGAWLNGEPLTASGCDDMQRSLVIYSFGRGTQRDSPDAERLLNMLGSVGSIRRLGSAALNLCYVAAGRVDAYWATQLSQWDVAAGWLIAKEAGATIADFRGRPLELATPYFCATATEALFEQLSPVLDID